MPENQIRFWSEQFHAEKLNLRIARAKLAVQRAALTAFRARINLRDVEREAARTEDPQEIRS